MLKEGTIIETPVPTKAGRNMHSPFTMNFKLSSGESFARISLNRLTGEFYYFPEWTDFLNEYKTMQLQASHDDIKLYTEPIDHISWHKDGTVHIRYIKACGKKTVVNKIEKPFTEFDRRTVLPLLSHSVRNRNNQEGTIICLIAGNDIIEDLTLLPPPYSAFVLKGHKSVHIMPVVNTESGLEFGYLFINISFFLPINDKTSPFSLIFPLQEEDVFELCQYLVNTKKKFSFNKAAISQPIPRKQ